ncbi:MAG: DUF2336 domain-containing protein [Rhodospirillales bacterium]|nr:DUF2336 domain-containing protein [Rhodospirillales bacterium]
MEFNGPISDEVKGLMALAQRRGQTDRSELFEKVAALFEERNATLNREERNLMNDIMHSLIRKVEMSVRVKLAERLAASADSPNDLISLLANDEIEVAHPILTSSDILTNKDLVGVIQHRTLQHQLAVAMRKNLSEEVSEALVETGNQHVIVTLISNGGARVSEKIMEFLVEESKRVDRYQGPLLQRRDLPTHLAVKMYGWVSEALRHYIMKNFKVEISEGDGVLKATVDELQAETISEAHESSPVENLAEKLHEENRLTPAFLVMTLRQGEISLFETAFAKFVNLRLDLMRELLYHRGAEGAAIACRAADMDLETFHTVYKLIGDAQNLDTALDEVEEKIIGDMFRYTTADSAQILMRQALRQQTASVMPLRRDAKIIPPKKINI